jgi:putative addiction module component (TIGR02574 family)
LSGGSGKGTNAANAVAAFCRLLPRPPFPAVPRHLGAAVRPGSHHVFHECEISAFSQSGGGWRGVVHTVANAGKNHKVTRIMNAIELVEAEIRRLPRKARQQVAERLNAQLWPNSFAPEVETAWADTVKRRLDDLDSGRVQGVPVAQVFARARRMLARR